MDTRVNAVIEKKLEYIDPLYNSLVLYTPVAPFKQDKIAVELTQSTAS